MTEEHEVWVERERPSGTGAYVLWILDIAEERAEVEGELHQSLNDAKAAAERKLGQLPWRKGRGWHLR